MKKKRERFNEQFQNILSVSTSSEKQMLELTAEKGASNWLNTLQIKENGYTLHRGYFPDALALRYCLPIKNLPTNCVCGQSFNVEHAMICKTGGFVAQQHDGIRNFFAHTLDSVCRGVGIEPHLQPLSGELLQPGTANSSDKARLDMVCDIFWAKSVQTYLDVRVFHPNAPSYIRKSVKSFYVNHENEKRRAYNDRIFNVERGTFTPPLNDWWHWERSLKVREKARSEDIRQE